MCFIGFVTSVPPACLTNSAGVRKLPWQRQTILTWLLVYLYRNPSIFLPFGPSPVVVTLGILVITSMPLSKTMPLETLTFFNGFSSLLFSAGLTDFALAIDPKVKAAGSFSLCSGIDFVPVMSLGPVMEFYVTLNITCLSNKWRKREKYVISKFIELKIDLRTRRCWICKRKGIHRTSIHINKENTLTTNTGNFRKASTL